LSNNICIELHLQRNRLDIANGIDADELGNVLYTLFGETKQKIRISLYIAEGSTFPKDLQAVKEGFDKDFEAANNFKITERIFNRRTEKDDKKCYCKNWGLCSGDEGRKCNGLTGACHGTCKK